MCASRGQTPTRRSGAGAEPRRLPRVEVDGHVAELVEVEGVRRPLPQPREACLQPHRCGSSSVSSMQSVDEACDQLMKHASTHLQPHRPRPVRLEQGEQHAIS